jgi:hypothetical protein
MRLFGRSLRNRPKRLGGARSVTLQIAEKACVDPFRSSHDVRINLRSVAQTPFRTVSLRTRVNKGVIQKPSDNVV